MDLNCSRCHQPVQDGYCYCPTCGLPQLVYSAGNAGDEGESVRWDQAARDAGAVDWRSALRSILPLAIPAGILCSTLSPVGIFGLLLSGGAAAWAVTFYMRRQRPAWITVGAGARIGLVCGLLAGALAFAASGCELYTQRYILHQGSRINADWKNFVDLDMQFSRQFSGWIGTPESSQIQAQEAQEQKWMLSPEGHAGIVIADFAFGSFLLVIFSMAGGALGARRLVRTRQS